MKQQISRLSFENHRYYLCSITIKLLPLLFLRDLMIFLNKDVV